jgi:CubicO group peptidase (beta-lactamase class C family)
MFRTALTTALSIAILVATAAGATSASAAMSPPGGGSRAASTELTRIYRGDDGGVLYLRRMAGTVYGFGEHPGRNYAYVLTGTVSGDRIDVRWWDVPKGTRTLRGTLRLGISQHGARLVRTSGTSLGPSTFTAISPYKVPWPNKRAAGFQSTSRNDLDGVWVGDDGSRHYVRDVGGDTVWVAEKAAPVDTRPGWVTVFIGKQGSGSGTRTGISVDVPKGLDRLSSSFGAAVPTGTRELALSQPSSRRTKWLKPDYAVDWARFERELRNRLDGNVVGYAFAIARDGAIMRSGAGGRRRLGIDGGAQNFTTATRAQTASAAKTINAAAIVKALHDRGLSVDAKVRPFLPSCLKLGQSMSTLTFRHILSHTSGLPRVSCNGGSPYDCLVRMLAEGRTQSFDVTYNTHAYDLLRWLVPLAEDTPKWKQIFERADCKNKEGVLNRRVSERFAFYVAEKVLAPAGARAYYNPPDTFSLNYDFADQTKRGEAPRADFFQRAGSGKLTMSVVDYVRFLTALERGQILPKARVDAMKGSAGNRLGFDGSWNGQAPGGYVWKNGGCPDFANRGRGCATAAMIFPSGIVAYVATNSRNNGYAGSIQAQLARAFDAALR